MKRVHAQFWIVSLVGGLFLWLPLGTVNAQGFTGRFNLNVPPTDTAGKRFIPQSTRVRKTDRDFVATGNAQALTKGYYFVQQIDAYDLSGIGVISTAREADSIAAVLNKHLVSGAEYGPIYFHQNDISACISVAKELQLHGIDLWLTSINLQSEMPAFNNDSFPSQYRACSIASDGSIVPATVWTVSGAPNKVPAFDAMNPQAMNWFLNRYKQVYLEPMKQYTSGYFFNEDCLFYASDSGWQSNTRINYNELPAYSDAVLTLWQKYCVDSSVMYNGNIVSKFPVASAAMVPKGGGKTEYYPGYNVPDTVKPGTALVSMPRDTGVWAAWDDFVTSQYVQSWIGGISKAVYEVNSGNPSFQGVIYFGLHPWSLGYEEVTDPAFCVDSIQRWVPWGTQRGVRLSKICSLPNVDYIVCETFPPIRANLYQFASEWKRISGEYGKIFGLMVHRDDNWGLDGADLETDRWAMIQNFQPTIVARYPINLLFPSDQYYNEQKENLFDQRMLAYRPVNPFPPVLISPVDQACNVSIAPMLIWGECVGASNYYLQVSKDSLFARPIGSDTIPATAIVPPPKLFLLSNGTTYYWRVRGITPGGASNWSSTPSFTTIVAVPSTPTLVSPVDSAQTVSLNPTLSWDAVAGAATYHLQVSTVAGFSPNVVDDTTLTATSRQVDKLSLATVYYWRVRAKNEGGYSPFSSTWQFKTVLTSVRQIGIDIPKEYGLNQNFPNPFNPTTVINYQLPVNSFVTLKVCDVLGREVATLVNGRQDAGYYNATFNAANLSSGVYFYRLQADNFSQVKKLLLLK